MCIFKDKNVEKELEMHLENQNQNQISRTRMSFKLKIAPIVPNQKNELIFVSIVV